MSDPELGAFASTIVSTRVSTLVSTIALLFATTINDFRQSVKFVATASNPVHFFLQEFRTVLQLLLEQLFLV